MKVLSLFDGISCGMVALERAGIPVERYVAFEIDEYAIQVSKKNYPMIEHRGNVFDADFTEFKDFDLLIGGSPCFTAGHLVLTNKGYKDIAEICIGDKVLTHENRFKPVVRTYTHKAQTVALDVVGYPTFITTPNHPFLTKTRSKKTYAEYKDSSEGGCRKLSDAKWTKVENMTKDTFCSQHIENVGVCKDCDLSNQMLWLLGRYIADGHIRKTKRSGRKNSYQYQFIISVGADKLNEFKGKMSGMSFSCYPHSQSVFRCVFSSMNLVNFVIEKGFGTTASEKHIPAEFMQLPDAQLEVFLDGYLSGDGHHLLADDSYHASTVSKCLAFELQRLFSRLYKTNVGVAVSKPRKKPHYIDGREIKSNFPLYNISFKKGVRKQSYAYIAEGKCWTGYRSCVPTGRTETVYNIEVADDHSYTVNNCIVHNCTYWSIAKNGRETTPEGMGGELFMQYVRALKESRCKYFLYENNYSIDDSIKDFISWKLGPLPIMINSSLVSAQCRKRCYWTNIPNVEQPTDRGLLLESVLDELSNTAMHDYKIEESVFSEKPIYEDGDSDFSDEVSQFFADTQKAGSAIRLGEIGKGSQGQRIYSTKGKSVCLSANGGGQGAKTGLYRIDLPDGRFVVRKLSPLEAERLQTLPDNYTEGISDTQRYKCIGNGWTVDVIAHILSGLHLADSETDTDW